LCTKKLRQRQYPAVYNSASPKLFFSLVHSFLTSERYVPRPNAKLKDAIKREDAKCKNRKRMLELVIKQNEQQQLDGEQRDKIANTSN